MSRSQIALLLAAALITTTGARAETIIKLGLSTDPDPDIELIGGMLSTASDGLGATAGDLNTEVTYLNTLLAEAGGQPAGGNNFSFTMDEVSLAGTPTTIGNTILQETAGGMFELWDTNNGLLLSGTLGNGILSGPIGGTATGGFLTAEFGDFTGGSLLALPIHLIDSTLSISLTDVNNGQGLSLDTNGAIDDFKADATANIGATIAMPEPSTSSLIVAALIGLLGIVRRRM